MDYLQTIQEGQKDPNTNFMPMFADKDISSPEMQINYDNEPEKANLDLQLRQDFEYGIVENQDNMFPDLSKEPLFVKTVPEVSVYNKIPQIESMRLINMSNKANEKTNETTNYSKLSVVDLSRKVSSNLLHLLDDLLTWNVPEGVDLNWKEKLKRIFVKEDRIFSIGILLIFISFFIIFFTSGM